MFEHFLSLHARGIEWFRERAHGAYAKAWLFFLSFTESSFLFIPPDILLVAILLAGSRQWLYYGALTAVASILGAVFGYAISLFFFDTIGVRIVDFYHLADQVAYARSLFNENAFWVIFTAAFTPIPYKVFVLAAGFLKVNFIMFLLASIVGRSLRYLIIAYAVHVLGKRATILLSRYSVLLTVAAIIIIAAFIVRQLL